MNIEFGLGAALFALGITGYVVGVLWAYPGRAFSIVAFMVGLLLLSTGRAIGGETG